MVVNLLLTPFGLNPVNVKDFKTFCLYFRFPLLLYFLLMVLFLTALRTFFFPSLGFVWVVPSENPENFPGHFAERFPDNFPENFIENLCSLVSHQRFSN